jgi:hypothetical protein
VAASLRLLSTADSPEPDGDDELRDTYSHVVTGAVDEVSASVIKIDVSQELALAACIRAGSRERRVAAASKRR